MRPYTMLSAGLGSRDATDLGTRLSVWHDAMVAHERRLRAGTTSDACDEECPHAEARTLWAEAIATFGARAEELTFLRSRAQETRRPLRAARATRARVETAGGADRRAPGSPADATMVPATTASAGSTEWQS